MRSNQFTVSFDLILDKEIILTSKLTETKERSIKISTITGLRCPEGSRKLRFSDYLTVAQDGGRVVSLTHQLLFTLRKYFCYSFLLEAESIPGAWCGRKDYVNEKFH